jgi:large subunit ribosomal protein L21
MYAVIESGGKQYRVAPGDVIRLEKLPVEPQQQLAIDRVLMVADGEKIALGTPFVEGAKVLATVLGHEKGRKIIVFKYKPKKNYHRKKGHRQWYTRVAITEILLGSSGGR